MSKSFKPDILLYDSVQAEIDKDIFFEMWTIENVLGFYVHVNDVERMQDSERALKVM
jgi:hypothetical protein